MRRKHTAPGLVVRPRIPLILTIAVAVCAALLRSAGQHSSASWPTRRAVPRFVAPMLRRACVPPILRVLCHHEERP